MCKCERGLKFEMEHARDRSHLDSATVIDQQDELNQKQEIYLVGLMFVGKKMVSFQRLFSFGGEA